MRFLFLIMMMAVGSYLVLASPPARGDEKEKPAPPGAPGVGGPRAVPLMEGGVGPVVVGGGGREVVFAPPSGIADVQGKAGFFVAEKGGIDAVDLADGKTLW